MRRASALVALVLACGCPRATTVRPTVDARQEAPTPLHAQATTSSEPVLVKIGSFDCAKYDVFPGEPPQKGIIRQEDGIRAWHGGGPNGANWNVEDLRCFIRATTPCAEGKVVFAVRVGQQDVAEREVAVSGGVAESEFVLPRATWEKGVDKSLAKAVPAPPYETATFRGEASIHCKAPMKADPKSSRFTSVVAEDLFVAGFASGE